MGVLSLGPRSPNLQGEHGVALRLGIKDSRVALSAIGMPMTKRGGTIRYQTASAKTAAWWSFMA